MEEKKLYLILGSFLFILFLAVIIIKMISKNKPSLSSPQNFSFPTITSLPVKKKEKEEKEKKASPSFYIPENLTPTFTGVKEEENQEEIIVGRKIIDLQGKLPLKINNAFEIRYDYQKDRFVVILYAPVEESQRKFFQWLKENDFDKIPQDYFEFR